MVYLIERHCPTEKQWERHLRYVCASQGCVFLLASSSQKNKRLYILGVFSVFGNIASPVSPVSLGSPPAPYLFLLLHALYKHVTSVLAYVTSPPSGQRHGSTLVRFHAFKIYFHVLCFVHTYVLINLMYYFGNNDCFCLFSCLKWHRKRLLPCIMPSFKDPICLTK